MQTLEKSTLYVVATPLGNLGDFSPRAIETLKNVDLIAAEDTRHSRPLLQYFGIAIPLISLHSHNEREHTEEIISRLKNGESVGLISDAGTPLISDPGAKLLEMVHANGLNVKAIPGASAITSALSIAGFPADQFIFEGFLPSKPSTRRSHLETLIKETRTQVFYEAPHRILETIEDFIAIFGETRRGALVKEISKIHETCLNGSLTKLKHWLEEDPVRQKGEFVIILGGFIKEQTLEEISNEAEHILKILCKSLPIKEAARLTAEITQLSKNKLYAHALTFTKGT
jgi:16S rRNA (cytidine1402-2'-O)-methyltransferase